MATLLAEPFLVQGVLVQPVLDHGVNPIRYSPVGITGFKGSGKNEVAKRFVAKGWSVGSFALAIREELFGVVSGWSKPTPEQRDQAARSRSGTSWHVYNYDKEFAEFLAFVEEHKRDVLCTHNGWVRPLLQAYGHMRRSTKGESYWLDQVSIESNTVIDDLRFLNEGERIKAERGRVILVLRPGYKSDGSASEEEIARIPADYSIVNDGSLEQLWSEADRIAEDILRRGFRENGR